MITAYRIRQLAKLSDAALTFWQDYPLLILPKSAAGATDSIASALTTVGLTDAHIHFVAEIPKDPRHFTKIDWERLQSELKGALSG
jgi:hypothetical protein